MERKTSDKYRYSPSWLDRAKKAEAGGMPDSKGELNRESYNSAGYTMRAKGGSVRKRADGGDASDDATFNERWGGDGSSPGDRAPMAALGPEAKGIMAAGLSLGNKSSQQNQNEYSEPFSSYMNKLNGQPDDKGD
jgi:hypothetical protein